MPIDIGGIGFLPEIRLILFAHYHFPQRQTARSRTPQNAA